MVPEEDRDGSTGIILDGPGYCVSKKHDLFDRDLCFCEKLVRLETCGLNEKTDPWVRSHAIYEYG